MNQKRLGVIAICVGVFLFFFLIKFPFENLKGHIFQKIYKQTGIVILAEKMNLAILGWPGISLKGVDVSIPVQHNRMNLSAKSMTARAGLGSLFPPTPSFSLYFDGLREGGDLFVKLKQGKQKYDVVFDAEKVNLSQLDIPGMAAPLSGQLTSDSNLFLDLTSLNKSSGDLDLRIREMVIPPQDLQPFMVLPTIKMGTFDARIRIRNGKAVIQDFKFGDPKSDLRGSIEGEIELGKSGPETRLDLQLHIQISETLKKDPNAASLVSLLNGYTTKTPNHYGMKWNATLREMSTNTFAALPKRLEE